MEQEFSPLPAPQLAEVSFFKDDGKQISVLTDEGLMDACRLRIAFTGRRGGMSAAPYSELNLGGHVGDDPCVVAANRDLLLEAMGAPARHRSNYVEPIQVHGDIVLIVGKDLVPGVTERQEADGIVCSHAGVPVLLCFADCVSVIIVAPGGAFAVAHAGWRGALAGIPGKSLHELAAHAGCDAADCNAYIGPHIGACCYETSQEVLDQFVERFGARCDAGDRHLDLTAAVTASLLEAGANAERIIDAQVCTSCSNEVYFSYRADGGVTGRHGAFAYLS